MTSYLVCYTALALVALFKEGRNVGGHGPGQTGVDRLLMAEDNTITQNHVIRRNRKSAMETKFTEIRNDFVHAEDRADQDPSAAAAQMKLQLARFRSLTGSILAK